MAAGFETGFFFGWSLTVPVAVADKVSIPETLEGAQLMLDGLGGHWGTAAIVFAYTCEGTPGPKPQRTDLVKSNQISFAEFAALGIRGLSTRNSVRKYRNRWEQAIELGFAEPVKPGSTVELPDAPFNTFHERCEKQEREEITVEEASRQLVVAMRKAFKRFPIGEESAAIEIAEQELDSWKESFSDS
jgi:hypothetical protein